MKHVDPKSQVLCLHSGAGGQLIAALFLGYPVVGSYEPVKPAALKLQRVNFPQVHYSTEWPSFEDLHGTIVLARCAYSRQKPTMLTYKRTMVCALQAQCDALAIESKPSTMEGLRLLHDNAGARWGYHVYRIRTNYCTHYLPQWRPRFWIVFMRKDLRDNFVVHHLPLKMILREALDRTPDAEPLRSRGIDRMVGISGLAPALAPQTNLIFGHNGRALSLMEYQRICGYPDNYVWPQRAARIIRKALNDSIAPPVAMWLLDLIERNIHHPRSLYYVGRGENLRAEAFWLQPGWRADLCPSRELWSAWSD
jgi:hypothetical protein